MISVDPFWLLAAAAFVLLSIAGYSAGLRFDLLHGRRTFWYFAAVATIAAVVFHFMWLPLMVAFAGSVAAFCMGYANVSYLILAAIVVAIVSFVMAVIARAGGGR